MFTTLPNDPNLDLDPWVGQRSATFIFRLVNGVTGQKLGEVNPIRGSGELSHDTSRTIKRQLNLSLGVADTSSIDPVADRIEPVMVVAGQEYPLGRYMFTDFSKLKSTGGDQASITLTDEMFMVDQQITSGFDATTDTVPVAIQKMLVDFPTLTMAIEASPFTAAQAWSVGTNRGQMLEALAVSGDYFSPWFDNLGRFRMIRSFKPAMAAPDFDFDAGNQVFRDNITDTNDLLTAPNRFVVVSNASTDPLNVVSATMDVPPNAPHSITNRGFVIASVQTLPVVNLGQAQAVAQNLSERQTIFERIALNTPPDPRHDSFNVIRWQGDLWLELAWSMALSEGASMNHTLRKAYL